MSQNYLLDRVSSLASGQLPDHVRMQYENFVLFTEAYYEFLEQKSFPQEIIQNIPSYGNIDETIDSFITYFYKNYIADFPVNPRADKKHALKRINELYQRKGSEKAIKLLFRLMYNDNADFYYPEIQVFKASAGRWKDRVSIFVSGNFNTLIQTKGRRITGVTSNANARVKDVLLVKPEENIVELELDRKSLNGNFTPNENINCFIPTESNEYFILVTHNAFLNRDPTLTETLDYVEQLESSELTPAELLKAIAISAESQSYLVSNLDFIRVLCEQALGRFSDDEKTLYDTTYGPALDAGSGRETIVDSIIETVDSIEYLKYVLRGSKNVVISANVRPIVSNIVVANTSTARGYNYTLSDTFNVVTNKGNLTAVVTELSAYSRSNFNSNVTQNPGLSWANGLVKLNIINDDFTKTVNVTSASVSNTWTSTGRLANLVVNIGALAEYSPKRERVIIKGRSTDIYNWKPDFQSKVQESVISLPQELNGGAVFRGRKDDGAADTLMRAFIDTAYQGLLNRNASNAEILIHRTTLKNSELSSLSTAYADVIVNIAETVEFKTSNNFKNPEDLIITLFRVCQDRYPETPEFKYYLERIRPTNRSINVNDTVKVGVIEEIAKSLASLKFYSTRYSIRDLPDKHVYYQPFSYEIRSNQDFNVYKEIVKKRVHPAGLVFFGSTSVGGSTEIVKPGVKLPPKVAGVGSIKGIYQYLNVPIRVLKTLPLNAIASFAPYTTGLYSSVTKSNADISYIGSGPHFETIDRWKYSFSATDPDQDQWQVQNVANILLTNFEAANLKQKYEIAPPLYTSNAKANPWTYSITPSSNTAGEGQVITFTINTANVPDGTQIVYVIEESGSLANNDVREGDIGLLLDGLIATAPTANAAYLNYENPAAPSGFYYVNWSNVSYNSCKENYTFNPVLAYCLMDGSSIGSTANGWIRLDTDLLSVYDSTMGVRLNKMVRSGTSYEADSSDGLLKTLSIPLPYNTRGVRIEYINLENENFADSGINLVTLDKVFNASQGQTVNLGSNFAHFGVSVHSANNSSNSYLSLSTLNTLQATGQGVNFFGNAGSPNKLANATSSYFTQTNDVGFNIDTLVFSHSESSLEKINLQNMRIWIR